MVTSSGSPGSSSLARSFEGLWNWQQARELVREVYRDFGEGTPASHDYGFRKQIQSAAISIMNNIAEGFERDSDVDFARFLSIAKASCGEVRSMYYLAEDLSYATKEAAETRRCKARQISSGIASFRNRLLKDSS